jgi:CheY-like chemotaxis protein
VLVIGVRDWSTNNMNTAPRILLVEDDADLRNTLACVLTQSGYEVAEAPNGRLALQHMEQQPAEIVVTDMLMPEMEGVETIMAIRRTYPSVKVIAISGGGINSGESYLAIARVLGTHKILSKPFVPLELLEAIRELIGTQ